MNTGIIQKDTASHFAFILRDWADYYMFLSRNAEDIAMETLRPGRTHVS
jgi:hypothetical protein